MPAFGMGQKTQPRDQIRRFARTAHGPLFRG
jgi:hypothetical protein